MGSNIANVVSGSVSGGGFLMKRILLVIIFCFFGSQAHADNHIVKGSDFNEVHQQHYMDNVKHYIGEATLALAMDANGNWAWAIGNNPVDGKHDALNACKNISDLPATCKIIDVGGKSDFMKNRSERVRTSCTDPEDLSRYCNNVHYPISGKTGYEWNSYITGVPICTCCRYSKERQDENRMNMLSQNGENYATPPSHFKNSQEYHRSIARSYPKPDMSHIPKDIKLDWPTPLDYSLTYWNLTDPTESSWGVWFWHPDLSADEYMRYQQYKRNLAIEDARSEMDNRDSTDSTDSWMDSE